MSSSIEVSGWQVGLNIRATLPRTQIKRNNTSKDGKFVHRWNKWRLEDHDRNVLETVGGQTRIKQVTLDVNFKKGPFSLET